MAKIMDIYREGIGWKIEYPKKGAEGRRGYLYSLWRTIGTASCRRWQFIRLMSEVEAEVYGSHNGLKEAKHATVSRRMG